MTPPQAALLSLMVGILVFVLKYLAYHFTGSVALYSDALESIVNIVAAGAALIALRVAALPADPNHPYGHTKAEYFSAVLEGVLILFAAITIFQEAYKGFRNPHELQGLNVGVIISLVASGLNGFLGSLLIRTGRALRSPALTADGKHVMTDVVTSVGVLLGVILAGLTGIKLLDPLIAMLVAFNILWTGWQLMKESVGGLMDAAPRAELLEQVRNLVGEYAEGALEAHDLRARHAGRITFIEFHLVVPGRMTVEEAHSICDRIEEALKTTLHEVEISIHVEPESKAKHHGIVVL
ncbi:cation diffusion facilitator family transporter [Deinococcus roseus]|uniref:Cadmium transporter n=1 Tax=Deinococcus roseus TaxID=392414 RepID=A0ABQ2D1T4_9DEIO|nr:cation diffusion facilitator family transporter [Deinococcus roseus]GGJ42161.1 cadmium transporter [Deinococcus roseus]